MISFCGILDMYFYAKLFEISSPQIYQRFQIRKDI